MNNPSLNYKIREPQRYQIEMQLSSLDMLIPPDHVVRDVWNFISEMDLRPCFDHIKTWSRSEGRSTTSPKILLAVWIYSIIDGNISARKLEELCKNHNIYKWIVGGAPINRTMLAEFRSQNTFKFEELLGSCLAVMLKHGIIKDTDFAQDGTRVKANAGFNSFRKEETLEKLEEQLQVYINQLSKEVETCENAYEKRQKERKQERAIEKQNRVKKALEELELARALKIENGKKNHEKVEENDLKKMRASITDPEVRKMKMGDGGYRLAYNVQFATGLDSRVIFGVDVVNTLDPGTSSRMIGKVISLLRRLGMRTVRNWFGDSAYSGKEDINTNATLYPEITYYGPPKTMKGIDPKKHLKNDSEAVKRWRDLIGDKTVEALYKKRCSTAEFSNAQTKNHGFTEASVRGVEKVKGEALLHAIGHNIQRFFNLKEIMKRV